MTNYDLVAIGDTVVDAFIKLKDAEINCDLNKEQCKLCVAFGEKIPYESVTVVPAVGNSANAAVSAARLGLASALVSNVGQDQNGELIIKTLQGEKVATDFVATNPGLPTNYHYVLSYEAERTILIKHEVYPYNLSDIGEPKWLYLSSLGETSTDFHTQIATYLTAHTDVKLAFQPGTFQIKLGKEALAALYKRTEVFICNKTEAEKILGVIGEIPELLTQLAALGPKIVLITDGPKGAYVLADNTKWFMPPYPDIAPPQERTGAGDAYASTFVSALALSKTVLEALMWAPINSMSVVQKIGAQAGLLTRQELEHYLVSAPADYRPKQI
ncbi:MAG: carbohydrate kinase family protein [Candidatus Vogelbacteria bacterium]|nr:carbohydrate kinase family protein [Candidatus Vogelbacteria bacterium]